MVSYVSSTITYHTSLAYDESTLVYDDADYNVSIVPPADAKKENVYT